MAGAVKKRAITEICLYEGTNLVADSTSEKDLAWYSTILWTAVSISFVSLYETHLMTHLTWKMFRALLKFLLTLSWLI